MFKLAITHIKTNTGLVTLTSEELAKQATLPFNVIEGGKTNA